MRINGHVYPPMHPGWGALGEEVFFYTSRYFCCVLNDLLSEEYDAESALRDYHANELNAAQRFLLAWLLAMPPTPEHRHELYFALQQMHALHKQHQ